jgi:hypothetical protein
MSFFNALLGAMNKGGGIYNEDKKFENTLLKDKATYDNTRSSTALNNQKFDFNTQLNPDLLAKAKMFNSLQGQQFDFNASNNPYLIDKNRLGNETSQQTLDFNTAYNPMRLQNQALTNAGQLNTNKKSYLDVQDQQGRFDTVDVIRKALADNPEMLNRFNAQYAIGAKSSGFGTGKGTTTKPTFVHSYNPESGNKDGTFLYDPATNSGTRIQLEGATQRMPDGTKPLPIVDVLNEAMNTNFGTGEFNDTANRADFNVKANEVYQAFLKQTNDPVQAQSMTQEFMFKQLGLDDDTEFGPFSDKELDYTPSNAQQAVQLKSKDEFDALPIGTAYILPNGQTGVK